MENLNVKPRESAQAQVVGRELPPRGDHQPQDAGLFATGLRHMRRVIVLIVGGVVLLAGAIMLVTPGPGLIGIALGLGILSIEFAWARSLLHRFKEKYMQARNAFRGKRSGRAPIKDHERNK